MAQRLNHRHPAALQAEVKRKLLAEGKIDEYGNRIVKGEAMSPPPPPPPATPSTMLRTGGTEVRKTTHTSAPVVLSAKEKLEALPDAALIEKAKALGIKQGSSRKDLILKLLDEEAAG